MKKVILTVVFIFTILVPDTFAQTMSDLLNLNTYSSLFRSSSGTVLRTYTRAVSDDDHNRIAALDGNLATIDTNLKIALLSSAAGVVDVRPVEATRMLGTPRQAELKFGAALFQEIQIMRFLGNTATEGRLRLELKYRIDHGTLTEAEIETYYRNGIRRLVSDIVDEEFNKPGRNNIVPARVYASWTSRGVAQGTDAIALIKETLTNFFRNPTQANYERVRGIIARYSFLGGSGAAPMASSSYTAYTNTITTLNNALTNQLNTEVTPIFI